MHDPNYDIVDIRCFRALALVRSIDHIILPKHIRTSGWSGIQKSVNGTPGLDSDLTWSVGLERVQLQL